MCGCSVCHTGSPTPSLESSSARTNATAASGVGASTIIVTVTA